MSCGNSNMSLVLGIFYRHLPNPACCARVWGCLSPTMTSLIYPVTSLAPCIVQNVCRRQLRCLFRCLMLSLSWAWLTLLVWKDTP
jgi:hypothetical protein